MKYFLVRLKIVGHIAELQYTTSYFFEIAQYSRKYKDDESSNNKINKISFCK